MEGIIWFVNMNFMSRSEFVAAVCGCRDFPRLGTPRPPSAGDGSTLPTRTLALLAIFRGLVDDFWDWGGNLARQRLSKPIGRDGSPSRPTPAVNPHLSPPPRWLATKFQDLFRFPSTNTKDSAIYVNV